MTELPGFAQLLLCFILFKTARCQTPAPTTVCPQAPNGFRVFPDVDYCQDDQKPTICDTCKTFDACRNTFLANRTLAAFSFNVRFQKCELFMPDIVCEQFVKNGTCFYAKDSQCGPLAKIKDGTIGGILKSRRCTGYAHQQCAYTCNNGENGPFTRNRISQSIISCRWNSTNRNWNWSSPPWSLCYRATSSYKMGPANNNCKGPTLYSCPRQNCSTVSECAKVCDSMQRQCGGFTFLYHPPTEEEFGCFLKTRQCVLVVVNRGDIKYFNRTSAVADTTTTMLSSPPSTTQTTKMTPSSTDQPPTSSTTPTKRPTTTTTTTIPPPTIVRTLATTSTTVASSFTTTMSKTNTISKSTMTTTPTTTTSPPMTTPTPSPPLPTTISTTSSRTTPLSPLHTTKSPPTPTKQPSKDSNTVETTDKTLPIMWIVITGGAAILFLIVLVIGIIILRKRSRRGRMRVRDEPQGKEADDPENAHGSVKRLPSGVTVEKFEVARMMQELVKEMKSFPMKEKSSEEAIKPEVAKEDEEESGISLENVGKPAEGVIGDDDGDDQAIDDDGGTLETKEADDDVSENLGKAESPTEDNETFAEIEDDDDEVKEAELVMKVDDDVICDGDETF